MDSIVAVLAGWRHRFSRYRDVRGERRDNIVRTLTQQTSDAHEYCDQGTRRNLLPQPKSGLSS
jgi:hypothetical protein